MKLQSTQVWKSVSLQAGKGGSCPLPTASAGGQPLRDSPARQVGLPADTCLSSHIPQGRTGRQAAAASSQPQGARPGGHLSGGHVSGRSGRGGPGPQAPAAPAGIGSERRPAPPRGPFLTVLRRLRARRPPRPTPVGCGWPCPGLQFLTRRALGGTRGTQGPCSRLMGETEGELEPPTAVRDTVRVRPFHRHRAPPGDPRRCAGCSRFEGEAAK